MERAHEKWHSDALGREMELLRLGKEGQNFLVFPTARGRFFDWENFSIVGSLRWHIDNGWVQLTCVDSIDSESWFNFDVHPGQRAFRHAQYDGYLYNEVVPFIREQTGNPYIAAVGCSFGGFHAANFGLKHPDVISKIISLSGSFDIRDYVYGHYDDNVYFNNPVDFLSNLTDERILGEIRRQRIILATSQEGLPAHGRLVEIFRSKGIPFNLETPGGACDDWPFWRSCIAKYL